MNRSPTDASHLYHDSHFTGLSGGAVEAREHLRAREVNAREERLLRQHDRHLRQAKDTCRRRSRWEQDSVRRDLQAILERTPTFDRTLRDEKQKLEAQHYCSYGRGTFSPGGRKADYRRLTGGGRKDVVAASSKVNALSGAVLRVQKHVSPPGRSCLPPMFMDHAEGTKAQVGSVPNARRRNHVSPQSCDSDKYSKQLETEHLLQGKPVPRGLKYNAWDSHAQAKQQESPDHSPSSPTSDQDLALPAADVLGLAPGQFKGADLRRRSHHAVMAIVRVQARHERRMREADATLARAAVSRRHRFSSQPSSSLAAEMSKLISRNIGAVRNGGTGPTDQKLSWLSLPVAGMPRRSSDDVTTGEVRGGDRDEVTERDRPDRPRFYSLD